MKFSVYQVSRKGGREKNEDRMGYCYTRDAGLFTLADGMGGHPEGEVASQMALQTLSALFQRQAKPGLADPLKFLREAIIEGAVQTAVVMLLVAASALVGVYLTEQQVPQNLALAILEFTDDRYAVLALLNIFFLVIGLFLHSAAAIILVVPIVMPLISAVGIDPVHFGLVVTLNLGIGQQTPPVASVLITACSIAKADIWEVSKVNIYFIGVLFVILMMVTYLPVIPMSLVELFYR